MELNGLAMVSASGTRGAKFGGSVVEKLEARGLDVKTVEELSAIIEEQDDSAEFLLTKSKRCEQFVLVDVALLSASGASYIDAKWLLAGDEAWVTMQMYRDQKTAQGLPTTCSAWVSQLLYQGEDFAVCQQLADQLGRDKVRSIKSLFTVGSNEVSAAGTKGVFREFEAKRKKHAKLSVQEFIALVSARTHTHTTHTTLVLMSCCFHSWRRNTPSISPTTRMWRMKQRRRRRRPARSKSRWLV